MSRQFKREVERNGNKWEMVERERERSKQFKRKIMRDRKKREWKSRKIKRDQNKRDPVKMELKTVQEKDRERSSREIERRKNRESSRESAWDLGNRIHWHCVKTQDRTEPNLIDPNQPNPWHCEINCRTERSMVKGQPQLHCMTLVLGLGFVDECQCRLAR